MKFSGSNVFITGASRGIGASVARVLAAYGLKVWIGYRSDEDLALSLKESIEEDGFRAAIIYVDVGDENSIIEAFKAIIDSDAKLDYLVNNAGITNDKLAIRTKVDDFNKVININLLGTFICCREALKCMSKNHFGSIVNISSIVGEKGNPGQTNYSASKGGVIAMSKSFAYEGASRNIRFNVVTPGFVDTDMVSNLKEGIKEQYLKNIPLNRLASPTEIANAIAFLLSDSASYITGEVLKVNGGLYM